MMASLLNALKRQVSFAYNKVYVVQSLPQGERKTGEVILDAFQYQLMAKGPYTAELIDISSKKEFLSLFNEIAQRAYEGENPILHLEIHGAQSGLELANGDFLTWIEIAAAMRPINIGCQHNLLVTLAVCSGANLWTAHDIKLPAPFFGLIGVTNTIYDSEIAKIFADFYHLTLIEGKSDEAIHMLMKANLKSGAAFQFQVSENLFLEEIQSINNRMLDFDRFSQYQGMKPNRDEKRKRQKQHKESTLKVVKKEFYKYKKIFFMEDLYPENRDRFNFSYEDTLAFSQFEFIFHPSLPIPNNLKPY